MRVLIVSQSPLARAGIEAVLQPFPDVQVVGAGGMSDAASLAGQLAPDATILDVGAGEPEDLENIAVLAAAQPGLPIVAVSGQTSGLAQALSCGALALLPAGISAPTLRAALLAAIHGLVALPRADAATLVHLEEPRPAGPAPAETLTPRELEVLQWMVHGLTNRRIAERLRVSEHTIKFHVTAILGKLGARTRAEAVARAIRVGWILV